MKRTFWSRTEPTTPDDCGTIDPLLSVYADGLASAEEARRVEKHLPACAACRESLAWTQATQRALALRPVASPPDDLRARIASAIAASSAAPISVSTSDRRAFVLRPAYAAAASLTALGVVISYGLLHTQAPPASTQPAVTPPPMVAVVPHVNSSVPAVKPRPGHGVKPPVVHHQPVAPKPARLDPDRVARVQPDEAPPVAVKMAVKTPAREKAVVKVPVRPAPLMAFNKESAKPHGQTVKTPSLPKFHPKFQPEMMAKAPKAPVLSVKTHRLVVVPPETKKPETIVATLPHDPPVSVPVNVGVPSIKHDPAPTVVVASSHESHVQQADLLSSVNAHVKQMRNVGYLSGHKSVKEGVLAMTAVDQGKTPGISITSGSF